MREELLEKGEKFSTRILKLTQGAKGEVASGLQKCGMAVGCNIFGSNNSISKQHFISILFDALRSAGETEFWLKIYFNNKSIKEKEYNSVKDELKEIVRLLVGTINANRPQPQQ